MKSFEETVKNLLKSKPKPHVDGTDKKAQSVPSKESNKSRSKD